VLATTGRATADLAEERAERGEQARRSKRLDGSAALRPVFRQEHFGVRAAHRKGLVVVVICTNHLEQAVR
jgi:hypothetical protein